MDTILTEIEAFCKTHGLSDAQFGRLAVNDTKFVGQLREKDREPRRKTIARVRHAMATYQPDTGRAAA